MPSNIYRGLRSLRTLNSPILIFSVQCVLSINGKLLRCLKQVFYFCIYFLRYLFASFLPVDNGVFNAEPIVILKGKYWIIWRLLRYEPLFKY